MLAAAERARAAGQPLGEYIVLSNLARAHEAAGRWAAAAPVWERMLVLAQEMHDATRLAAALGGLGLVLGKLGDYERALPLLEKAVMAWRTLGVPHFEAQALGALANATWKAGDLPLALERFAAARSA